MPHNAINTYINQLNTRFKAGHTSEHTFRKDLEDLLNALVPNIQVTNEPSKITDCGNPDYVLHKGKVPVGFIEAKDINKDLKHKQYKEQFDRYKKALDNLIITDYLIFEFYDHGELTHRIAIGEVSGSSITPVAKNFEQFASLIKEFVTFIGQTIKSAHRLATLMAGKARLLENILQSAVESDEETDANTELREQYATFKSILIHDLTPAGFADIYAQTLAYGMFAARLHDDTLDTFSRAEAAERIPKTNPFLKRLFDYVAGVNIDERIKTTLDNLADVFRATDVRAMLTNFGKSTQSQDPIIHFYEDFLSEYNPKLRKQRGVWYTPEPVVKFIVRAVDDVLKADFGLQGLADTSKTTIEVQTQTRDARTASGFKSETKEVHKVQILDPATGTGTFLAAVVQHIYAKTFSNMAGMWSSYVENDLIPRLNGFELLMASYAMAHLKLDMLLTDTGYVPKNPKRLNVFLTNSLEEHHPDTGTLFASWLSQEANAANAIKRDKPVMVVLGNPPYSVSSSNKGEWIQDLMEDYKKGLNERNIQPLSDDYIKFIRYGQYYIERNGEGILAFITNNSFIDGVIHRQMRKSLLETFDKIYILDLHGNTRKKETTPTGGKDENVFDIMAGVSINIFIKTGKKRTNELGEVRVFDLFGTRDNKYTELNNANLNTIQWKQVKYQEPEYYFLNQNIEVKNTYEKGFYLPELFTFNSSGVKSHRDHFVVSFNTKELTERVQIFFDNNVSDDDVRQKLKLKDNRDWSISEARNSQFDSSLFRNISYRPFDTQKIYYDTTLIDFAREKTLRHLFEENLGILLVKQPQAANDKFFDCIFIANNLTDTNFYRRGGPYIFPLYLYPESDDQQSLTEQPKRTPNLNQDIITAIEKSVGLSFVPEPQEGNLCFAANNTDLQDAYKQVFTPLDLLDYIYAVLHSPTYRDTYKEFLKIDFPRVPYPTDATNFWQLVALGGQLRGLHLLESSALASSTVQVSYPVDGSNVVERKMTKNSIGFEANDNSELGKVWINDEQYFDNVPLVAWEFFIGGYQPAQKWLKDRHERTLTFEDLQHYQNIIKALYETSQLMAQVDDVLEV